MTVLIIILVLFIDRILWQGADHRHHRWFDSYCDKLLGTSLGKWLTTRPWGAVFALLPLLLVIGWLQTLFDSDFGLLFDVAFATLVLLFSIGPRDLGQETEAFLHARDTGKENDATERARAFCHTEAPDTEPHRSLAVARAVTIGLGERLIGPLFWFVLFGPVGAAAFRLTHLIAARFEHHASPMEMKNCSDELRHIIDWAPARITAAGYAIAGNFDAVVHAWRDLDYQPGQGPLQESQNLMAQTGLASLDTYPENPDELEQTPPIVEEALALVWRCLSLWVALVGIISLFVAIA